MKPLYNSEELLLWEALWFLIGMEISGIERETRETHLTNIIKTYQVSNSANDKIIIRQIYFSV